MKVIRPTAITDAILTASNIAENDAPAWSATTTYAKGAHVLRAGSHRIWESTIDANKGNDPLAATNTQWLDIGATNRWAMFDELVGSQTTATGAIEVTMAPGAIDALALVNTQADLITVTMTVDGTQLYSRTQSTSISGEIIDNWYSYFTAEVGILTAIPFLDVPVIPRGVVTVRAASTSSDGPVAVGVLSLGRVLNIGSTEAGPTVGITDYSLKTTDQFGYTTIVERPYSDTMECKALLPTSSVGGVKRGLSALRAKPAVWIGEEGFDELTLYGFFKDFSIDLTYPNWSYCSVSIEGLT